MKTQGHRNVSVMETSPRTRQISTRCFLPALFSMASLAVSGCGYDPPKDKNGNLPDDAVRNFIALVEADDYVAARKLWYGPAKLGSVQRKFEDFCARYKKIGLNNCRITKASKGKAGFSMVHVHFKEGGKEKYVFFGLKIVDGEWRMERGYYW